jgi:hypothetical protein
LIATMATSPPLPTCVQPFADNWASTAFFMRESHSELAGLISCYE